MYVKGVIWISLVKFHILMGTVIDKFESSTGRNTEFGNYGSKRINEIMS